MNVLRILAKHGLQLTEAIEAPSPQIDLDLINLLIVAGAEVNCLGAKSLQPAAKKGSLDLFELLIRSVPAFVAFLCNTSDYKTRGFRLKNEDHGDTPGTWSTRSCALTEVIEEKPLDKKMVLHLLKKANVDHHQGQALCKAVKCVDKSIVAYIIDLGHPSHRSRHAALPIVLEPATGDRLAKLELLLRANIDRTGLDKILVQEIRNSSNSGMNVVELILHRGAKCSHDGRMSLETAISSRNM